MKPVEALIFGVDDLFPKLKPYYDQAVAKGSLKITGYAVLDKGKYSFLKTLQGEPLENLEFQKVILSSQKQFMAKYKAMKAVFEKHRGGV